MEDAGSPPAPPLLAPSHFMSSYCQAVPLFPDTANTFQPNVLRVPLALEKVSSRIERAGGVWRDAEDDAARYGRCTNMFRTHAILNGSAFSSTVSRTMITTETSVTIPTITTTATTVTVKARATTIATTTTITDDDGNGDDEGGDNSNGVTAAAMTTTMMMANCTQILIRKDWSVFTVLRAKTR